MNKISFKKASLLVLILIVGLIGIVGCSSKGSGKIIVVGKNFTEQDIMAHMLGLLIEKNTDLNVEVKAFLGSTDITFNSVKTGNADLYVEYTGTGLVNIMGEEVVNDPDEAYRIVKEEFPKRYGIEWMSPIGFNNTYAMAVKQETAEKYNLEKVSDLRGVAEELTLGTNQEFMERPDGLPGLEEAYGFKFGDVKGMDTGLKYSAIGEDQVAIIDAYATDGQLISYNLKILEDDLNFFPPYYSAPIIRTDTLEKHPELRDLLEKLAGKIDDQAMAQMNAKVDIDQMKAKDVAEEWLKANGLIN